MEIWLSDNFIRIEKNEDGSYSLSISQNEKFWNTFMTDTQENVVVAAAGLVMAGYRFQKEKE